MLHLCVSYVLPHVELLQGGGEFGRVGDGPVDAACRSARLVHEVTEQEGFSHQLLCRPLSLKVHTFLKLCVQYEKKGSANQVLSSI